VSSLRATILMGVETCSVPSSHCHSGSCVHADITQRLPDDLHVARLAPLDLGSEALQVHVRALFQLWREVALVDLRGQVLKGQHRNSTNPFGRWRYGLLRHRGPPATPDDDAATTDDVIFSGDFVPTDIIAVYSNFLSLVLIHNPTP